MNDNKNDYESYSLAGIDELIKKEKNNMNSQDIKNLMIKKLIYKYQYDEHYIYKLAGSRLFTLLEKTEQEGEKII